MGSKKRRGVNFSCVAVRSGKNRWDWAGFPKVGNEETVPQLLSSTLQPLLPFPSTQYGLTCSSSLILSHFTSSSQLCHPVHHCPWICHVLSRHLTFAHVPYQKCPSPPTSLENSYSSFKAPPAPQFYKMTSSFIFLQLFMFLYYLIMCHYF